MKKKTIADLALKEQDKQTQEQVQEQQIDNTPIPDEIKLDIEALDILAAIKDTDGNIIETEILNNYKGQLDINSYQINYDSLYTKIEDTLEKEFRKYLDQGKRIEKSSLLMPSYDLILQSDRALSQEDIRNKISEKINIDNVEVVMLEPYIYDEIFYYPVSVFLEQFGDLVSEQLLMMKPWVKKGLVATTELGALIEYAKHIDPSEELALVVFSDIGIKIVKVKNSLPQEMEIISTINKRRVLFNLLDNEIPQENINKLILEGKIFTNNVSREYIEQNIIEFENAIKDYKIRVINASAGQYILDRVSKSIKENMVFTQYNDLSITDDVVKDRLTLITSGNKHIYNDDWKRNIDTLYKIGYLPKLDKKYHSELEIEEAFNEEYNKLVEIENFSSYDKKVAMLQDENLIESLRTQAQTQDTSKTTTKSKSKNQNQTQRNIINTEKTPSQTKSQHQQSNQQKEKLNVKLELLGTITRNTDSINGIIGTPSEDLDAYEITANEETDVQIDELLKRTVVDRNTLEDQLLKLQTLKDSMEEKIDKQMAERMKLEEEIEKAKNNLKNLPKYKQNPTPDLDQQTTNQNPTTTNQNPTSNISLDISKPTNLNPEEILQSIQEYRDNFDYLPELMTEDDEKILMINRKISDTLHKEKTLKEKSTWLLKSLIAAVMILFIPIKLMTDTGMIVFAGSEFLGGLTYQQTIASNEIKTNMSKAIERTVLQRNNKKIEVKQENIGYYFELDKHGEILTVQVSNITDPITVGKVIDTIKQSIDFNAHYIESYEYQTRTFLAQNNYDKIMIVRFNIKLATQTDLNKKEVQGKEIGEPWEYKVEQEESIFGEDNKVRI